MGATIRLPNITGGTEREQLAQIKSYLSQLAQYLQWAFDHETGGSGGVTAVRETAGESRGIPSGVAAQEMFNGIKALIIKSEEILDAYFEETERRLKAAYEVFDCADHVAVSGSSSGWRWHRWRSGFAELYGTVELTTAAAGEAVGTADGSSGAVSANMYRSEAFTVDLPLTVEEAVVTGNATDGFFPTIERGDSNVLQLRLYSAAPFETGVTVKVHLLVNGMVKISTEGEETNG